MKKPQGMLLGKFEFNSYGRLMWTLPELPLKTERVQLQAIIQERIPWALVVPTRVTPRSAEINPENRN